MTIDSVTAMTDLQTHFQELEASYVEALRRHRTLVRNFAGDSAGDDAVDLGTKAAASDEDEAELRRLAERRLQMERALERISAGSYGVCEVCGQAIPEERLRFVPDATSCVDCKQRAERR
jgi:DnaK suppressor protein